MGMLRYQGLTVEYGDGIATLGGWEAWIANYSNGMVTLRGKTARYGNGMVTVESMAPAYYSNGSARYVGLTMTYDTEDEGGVAAAIALIIIWVMW